MLFGCDLADSTGKYERFTENDSLRYTLQLDSTNSKGSLLLHPNKPADTGTGKPSTTTAATATAEANTTPIKPSPKDDIKKALGSADGLGTSSTDGQPFRLWYTIHRGRAGNEVTLEHSLTGITYHFSSTKSHHSNHKSVGPLTHV